MTSPKSAEGRAGGLKIVKNHEFLKVGGPKPRQGHEKQLAKYRLQNDGPASKRGSGKKFRVYVLTGPTFWRAEKALDTKRIFPLGFKLI